MDKVLGKYLVDDRNDFPLDCETFDYIQNNNFITEVLGNIAGDKCFIYGCKKSGSNYEPGYVFLRTDEHPEGEILPFSGGTSSEGKVYINSEAVSVNANDKTYSAYTKRSLSPVPTTYDKTGYDLNEFTYASYNQPLYGEIKIWSGPGFRIPGGYLPCDGRELEITKYKNLHDVIGDTYNKQHKGSHTTYNNEDDYYTTRDGYFRIPDLTARFIMGCDGNEFIDGDDVNPNGYEFGSQGGLSTCKLTSEQSGMPAHNHGTTTSITGGGEHTHLYAADDTAKNFTRYGLSGYEEKNIGPGGNGAGGIQKTSKSGKHTHTVTVSVHNSTAYNANKAHENKPPFMVLYYIIRCC